MTAKEYLEQAYWLNQRIQSKQEQIQSLNDLATRCTAAMTGIPHSPNHGGSQMADTISKIVDLQNVIAADMEALVNLKADISATIRAVSNVEYQLILEKRYICEKPWPEIAVELGYNMRHLYRLHDAALERIKVPQ